MAIRPLLCFCHFSMLYPGSGVVLDCIDSLSLPPFLLYLYNVLKQGMKIVAFSVDRTWGGLVDHYDNTYSVTPTSAS